MAYSIKPVLHHYQNESGESKILIQVICNRIKITIPTMYKVKPDQFAGGLVVSGKRKTAINHEIVKQIEELEGLMDYAIKHNKLSQDELKIILTGKKDKVSFANWSQQFLNEGRFTASTKQMYSSIRNVVLAEFPFVMLEEMNVEWFKKFEKTQKEKSHNTIHKIMKKTKTIMIAAAEKGLVDKEIFAKYMPPEYNQLIPEYLTESEVERFMEETLKCESVNQQLSGMYFLLSCFTGLRISDVKNFDFTDRIKDEKIILKAKKNGSIISMPIHTRLKVVLDHIKDLPLTISEFHIRAYVYKIAKAAGIDRRIKYHTSRHTFAMWLMDHDFSIEDVAELLGNDLDSARIYGRISNKRIEQKFAKL